MTEGNGPANAQWTGARIQSWRGLPCRCADQGRDRSVSSQSRANGRLRHQESNIEQTRQR